MATRSNCEETPYQQIKDPYVLHMSKITYADVSLGNPIASIKLQLNQDNFPEMDIEEAMIMCGIVPQVKFQITQIPGCRYFVTITSDNPDKCGDILSDLYETMPTPTSPICFIQNDQTGIVDRLGVCSH
ncbi:MAG: hypothetical protein AB2826_11590 [Candidatus Thiodiazotropha sp.]